MPSIIDVILQDLQKGKVVHCSEEYLMREVQFVDMAVEKYPESLLLQFHNHAPVSRPKFSLEKFEHWAELNRIIITTDAGKKGFFLSLVPEPNLQDVVIHPGIKKIGLITKVPMIRNYYGSLHIRLHEGKYYLQMGDESNGSELDDDLWKEIPLSLYLELLEYSNVKPGDEQ